MSDEAPRALQDKDRVTGVAEASKFAELKKEKP
jgi:hypothetical protein